MFTANNTTLAYVTSSFQLLHSRLGHASTQTDKKVLSTCKIPYNIINIHMFCDTCVKAKLQQLSFHKSTIVYSPTLELLYIDIWEPAPISSTTATKYSVAILDAYSKFTWLYLLHSKSQFSSVFVLLENFAETQTDHTLRSIQIDNAKEFLSLASYLNSHGI